MDRIKATKNATARDQAARKRKKSSSALQKEALPEKRKKSSSALQKEALPEKNKMERPPLPPPPPEPSQTRFMFQVDLPVVEKLQMTIWNDVHQNLVLVEDIKDGSPMMVKLVSGDELVALNEAAF